MDMPVKKAYYSITCIVGIINVNGAREVTFHFSVENSFLFICFYDTIQLGTAILGCNICVGRGVIPLYARNRMVGNNYYATARL